METPARNKRRNRGKTTEILLRAAMDCVIEQGPGALTITAVAQRAGYDKVLIYRYFGSLEGLKEAIVASTSLYPAPADTVSSARDRSGNPLESIASTLKHLIEATPLARALVIHRWHAGSDPLAKGLADARAKWLNGSIATVRNEWPDPQALTIAQLLAEEATATGEDLAWQLRTTLQFADDWHWPATEPDEAQQSVDPDVLPDNLL